MEFSASRTLVPDLDVVASTPSTNDELVRRARSRQLPSFTTLVTTDQTAGRGRLGRVWTAPPDTALAISVLIAPPDPDRLGLDRFGWLTIAAGVAMTEVVAGVLPHATVGFKWPNDVLVGGRKISGVLAELVPERGAVVIGVGININMTPDHLPTPAATSLLIEEAPPESRDADSILASYLGLLRALVDGYLAATGDADASGLAKRARDRCITLGKAVRVELPDETVLLGTAVEMDDDGRLVVKRADGRRVTVAAGDVTHARHVE